VNLWQALRYFFREASVSLLRSWKVSLLAVLTIAVSLFVSGVVLLVSSNLGQLVKGWRSQTKVVLYLEPDAPPTALGELTALAQQQSWVTAVEPVSAAEAEARFRTSFPSLGDLVEGWEDDPLPPSLELSFEAATLPKAAYESWIETMRQRPEIAMVDDDRDWLAQVSALITVVRGVGLALGAVLLGAAIFTIGSVIRLTAYMYHEEISIMRIVGATEFYIRGPFYVEGLLQGTLGAVLALGGLHLAHGLLQTPSDASLWGSVMTAHFLGWRHQLVLIALGAAAGLVGAIFSLRRESLGTADANVGTGDEDGA
jgi:cell division transport system permease protein